MIATTIFPGRYMQGRDATERLGEELARLGDRAFLICDPFALDEIAPRFRTSVETSVESRFERFGGESSSEEVDRLVELAKGHGSNVIVGIGGGKTLDTAKAVALELDAPVAIVPTIASTDAPCSALSVIYTPTGEVERYLVMPQNPPLVLVDSQIIAEAPVRFLVAGMGDALSTYFEADSCRQAYAANMTGDRGSMTAYALAELCYETLLEYGVAAKTSCEAQAVTPALERIIEANTLLSGVGFESGGLAACHAIHNGLTILPDTHDAWHGEKVTIGVLAQLFLTDKPWETIEEVYDFCEAVGLPTTLADIGLADATDEDLMRVAERACADDETIHNEPIPVTPHSVFAALKAANGEGERRKAQTH